MKKLISILLILLMSLATLISCEFSTKKDNEKETDESEKSVQSDTVNTDDELIPIHPNDCDNVDQELSSKLKKAFANAKKTDPSEIPITFYIKIEDCHIFRITDLMTDNMCYREIAGYTIEYGGYQTYHVYKDGNICLVADAYERGYLSKEGVYQFAIASGGKIVEESTAEPTIDYTDKTIPFHRYDSLDLEQELASDIKKAYARYMAKKSVDLVLTDIYVYLYYNIDGTHIVNFDSLVEQIVRVSTVAGYKISYPNGRIYYVFHENEVYTIEEAYEKGYITKEVIYNFAKKVANKIEEV